MAKKSVNPSKTVKKKAGAKIEKLVSPKAAQPVVRPIVPKKPSKTKPKRKPHATRPTPAEKLLILKRQNLVMDLKTAGIGFRKIALHLEREGYKACSVGTVYADYLASLERLQETNLDKTEYLVSQELEKIEEWEGNFATAFKNNRLSVFERIAIGNYLVTLQNQRDKFLAISKGKKAEINAQEALAKLLGIAPEELPDDRAGAV